MAPPDPLAPPKSDGPKNVRFFQALNEYMRTIPRDYDPAITNRLIEAWIRGYAACREAEVTS
jgi:hypothetical protein